MATTGGSSVTLIAGMLGDISEVLETVISQIVPNLSSALADTFYEMIADEASEADLPEEITAKLDNVFEALDNNDTESAKQYFSEFTDEIVKYYELDESDAAEINSEFNNIIDNSVDETGNFSYLSFLSATLDYVSDGEDDYAELQETIDSLQNIDAEELINNFLGETLDESTDNMIILVLLGVVLVTVGLCAFLWGILFLFDFFHTISKNRRFTVWYVKMFAWIPGVLFFAAPTFAITALPTLLGDSAAELTAVFNAISMTFGGSGVISGICYLLLWVMSIFWLFPIKHGIRKAKKEIKHRGLSVKQIKNSK
ncbi:MAG: hypothetical protein LUI60_07420 [Clostridia bacterium]|nr:hypothetical protein [Clostridia bacterium]